MNEQTEISRLATGKASKPHVHSSQLEHPAASLETSRKEHTMTTTALQTEYETTDAIIKQGTKTFLAVGNALVKMHEQKLYLAEFKTFEEYAASRGIKRRNAYKLMTAVKTSMELTDVPRGAHESDQQNQCDDSKLSGKVLLKLAEYPRKKQPEILALAKASGKVTAASIETAAATVLKTAQPKIVDQVTDPKTGFGFKIDENLKVTPTYTPPPPAPEPATWETEWPDPSAPEPEAEIRMRGNPAPIIGNADPTTCEHCYSRSMNQPTPRLCIRCGTPEPQKPAPATMPSSIFTQSPEAKARTIEILKENRMEVLEKVVKEIGDYLQEIGVPTDEARTVGDLPAGIRRAVALAANNQPLQDRYHFGNLTTKQFEKQLAAISTGAEATAAGNQKERRKFGVILNEAANRFMNPIRTEARSAYTA